MRIYKNKYYILKIHFGMPGSKQWDKWEYYICTGYKAQKSGKLNILKEFLANGKGIFRLEDGHLPEYQPIVKEKEIYDWLDEQRYAVAYLLNPEVYDLK